MQVKYSATDKGELSDDNKLKYMAIVSEGSEEYVRLLNPEYIKNINKRRYMERVNLLTFGLNPIVSRFDNFNDANNTTTMTNTGWSIQKVGGSANNTAVCYIFNGDKHFFYLDFYTKSDLATKPVIKINDGSSDIATLNDPVKLRDDDEGNSWYRVSWSGTINSSSASITIDMTTSQATDKIWITNVGLYNISRLGMSSMSDVDILKYIDDTKDYIYLDA